MTKADIILKFKTKEWDGKFAYAIDEDLIYEDGEFTTETAEEYDKYNDELSLIKEKMSTGIHTVTVATDTDEKIRVQLMTNLYPLESAKVNKEHGASFDFLVSPGFAQPEDYYMPRAVSIPLVRERSVLGKGEYKFKGSGSSEETIQRGGI